MYPTLCVAVFGMLCMLCTMFAAINHTLLFLAMSDYPAAAMATHGGQFVNRTLEGVECVFFAIENNLKCLLIVIPTGIAFRHCSFSPKKGLLLLFTGQNRCRWGN